MFNLGTPELIVILVVALIILGPKRLPELAKSLGRGLREFRKATEDIKDSLEKDLRPDARRPPTEPKPPGAPGPSASPNLIADESAEKPPPADAGPDQPAEAPSRDPGEREPGHGG